ncbi:hypothetical protein QFZ37_000423 [Chryseobacterium ginsenosidimutans]|uniref:hypothetical protein n=1 Tax=Chryseobacterium ginsenosidimutans TaxID=687846 RepID=UPI0027887808|nr:hypothetical protein [Chryseobacterium ginsenosidimutans]MDQ0592054.1 hypothetical protein [Chryseobacterium ginsenosidimutans]
MKRPLIIFFSCFLNWIYSQTCGCLKKPELKSLISCKPTIFKNKAEIFWEYNCNSSWITFQNGKKEKKIFKLEKELIEFSGRLGYINWTEYENSFLIENSIISGCCQPLEYILYSKKTGEKLAELGTAVFKNDLGKHPYTLTMQRGDEVLFTNLNNNKSCGIKVPWKKIEYTLKNSDKFYAEELFENVQLKNGFLSMQLKYKDSKNSKWKKEIITFNTIKCYK